MTGDVQAVAQDRLLWHQRWHQHKAADATDALLDAATANKPLHGVQQSEAIVDTTIKANRPNKRWGDFSLANAAEPASTNAEPEPCRIQPRLLQLALRQCRPGAELLHLRRHGSGQRIRKRQ